MQNTKAKMFLKQTERTDIFPTMEIQLNRQQIFPQQQQKPEVNKVIYPKQ